MTHLYVATMRSETRSTTVATPRSTPRSTPRARTQARSLVPILVGGLVVTLTACGGGGDSTLPVSTGGSTATSTSPPTTAPPTGAASSSASASAGSSDLAAQATYTYGDLDVVVNLPADIPTASRSNMALFTDFLQARGRTTAEVKLDPALTDLASTAVLTYLKGTLNPESVKGIGAVAFTVSKVQTGSSGISVISGCVDQSKLSQVRKDGTHFVDSNTKEYPTLKMTANVQAGQTGHKVTQFVFAVGTC